MVEMSEEVAKTCWFALTEYQEKLKKDLDTKYDGDPRWQEDEDGPFLREQIGKCEHALAVLQEQGIQF